MGDVSFTFLTILSLLFIVLKLTGYIAWSWILVLSPLLVGIVFTTAVALLLWVAGKFFIAA